MLNHTAIQVQNHTSGSGVNEISLIPITAAVGFLPGLAYGWSKAWVRRLMYR
jgi:NhaP-type Na+/H+ or K+/H+ antiporter